MSMPLFEIVNTPIDCNALKSLVTDENCGAIVTFEGLVRNHNEGRPVLRLEYEAYSAMAQKEGEAIVAAALEKFGISRAACVHRVGALGIGDCAVWVGVASHHRRESFEACRWIIDEIKHRVPIWKKEYYADGDSGWVNCARCGEAAHAHH